MLRFIISIHAPRVGSDQTSSLKRTLRREFQSTLPVWGATNCQEIRAGGKNISIHAPRVGSDHYTGNGQKTGRDFNPRSPCGERPVREKHDGCQPDFNPRSPCGERPAAAGARAQRLRHFNPRSPCGERHLTEEFENKPTAISIHAPRVGSDEDGTPDDAGGTYDFNPRSPCGERLIGTAPVTPTRYFNPRSPCGERHAHRPKDFRELAISIHAPRVGSDAAPVLTPYLRRDFNPRSPCGERHGGSPGGI